MSEENTFYQLQDEGINIENLQESLSAIAHELERFYNSSITPDKDQTESEEVLHKLIKCKSMLKCKKSSLKKLKNNLRTACIVTKTVLSAKENETSSLNNYLKAARNECIDLTQKNIKNENLIHTLTTENRILHQRLETISNFINLGYQELQKIRNERSEEQSVEIQLKKILICCGQYYANYCNEEARTTQLEQKNRFLNHRISILQSNLENITQEVKNLRNHKDRLQIQTTNLLNKGHNNTNILNTECKIRHQSNPNVCLRSKTKIDPIKSITIDSNDLDLTSHLSMVKYLLDDQAILLDDIKSISQELNSLDHVTV